MSKKLEAALRELDLSDEVVGALLGIHEELKQAYTGQLDRLKAELAEVRKGHQDSLDEYHQVTRRVCQSLANQVETLTNDRDSARTALAEAERRGQWKPEEVWRTEVEDEVAEAIAAFARQRATRHAELVEKACGANSTFAVAMHGEVASELNILADDIAAGFWRPAAHRSGQ